MFFNIFPVGFPFSLCSSPNALFRRVAKGLRLWPKPIRVETTGSGGGLSLSLSLSHPSRTTTTRSPTQA